MSSGVRQTRPSFCASLGGQHASPKTGGAPVPLTQRLQLHDLAVIHEEVYLRPIVLDIPGKDLRIRRLEHDPLESERIDELGGDIATPRPDVLGDRVRLYYDLMGAHIEEAARQLDHPSNAVRW